MERLEYDMYGGPEVVHLSTFELPPPKKDEVLVRVAAASINPMDWKIRSGAMKMFTGSTFPRGMGTDFSGTVEAVGPNVSSLKKGDLVLGTVPMKNSGAFAPMLIASEKFLVKKPESLSFNEAASLPIVGVTAWQALVQIGGLKRGQKVFINGALGGVGRAALAISKTIGADVVGRVGPQSIAEAHTMGFLSVLDYTKPIPRDLYGTFDIVFDCNGSVSLKEGGMLIKRGGKIIDIVPTPAKFIRAALSRSRKVLISDPRSENLQKVVDIAVAGGIPITITQTISLDASLTILPELEKGKSVGGKIVIIP